MENFPFAIKDEKLLSRFMSGAVDVTDWVLVERNEQAKIQGRGKLGKRAQYQMREGERKKEKKFSR